MRYGTRFSVGEREFADLLEQRGKEIERLRLALAEAERQRDDLASHFRVQEAEVARLKTLLLGQRD